MIFNSKVEQPNDIEGVEITNRIKYLGVEINNKGNCLDEYKKYNV